MASIVTGLIEQVKIDAGANQSIASTAYGVCNTLSDSAAKTVEMTGFKLITGVTVHIKFTYSNAAENPPTLNINNTGAKPIVQYGTTSAGTNVETNGWQAGAVLSLTYDGTSWVRDQGYNTNTNTWRGIQDNLTSDSATDSLSAKQGKALKGLIDAMDATTPNASGNTTAFIDSITQTDGKITSITKKNIPTVSSSTAGLAPKGTAVSTQTTSTKFLREDGTWAAPSYITNVDTKVTQTGNTENKEFSILLKNTDNTSDETNGVKFGKTENKLVTVNPSTGRITASGGLAGKADSATVADSANAVAWGNVSSKPTSIKLTGAVTGSVTLGSGENSIATTVNHTHAYLSSIAWDNSNKKITQSVNGATATAILEFVAGSNITLTPAAGKLTIANTYSYTLPLATYNVLGGLKPAYSSTGAATLTTAAATNTDTPTIVAKTTTSGRYYAVEADKNGIAYVNVPWTDHYAWGDITSKPATATRWPTWDEVTSKPSTFSPSAHTHSYITSRGNVTNETGGNKPAQAGLSMSNAYNNGYPITYGNVLTMYGSGASQLLIGWSGSSSSSNGVREESYIRSQRDTAGSLWSAWEKILTSGNTTAPSTVPTLAWNTEATIFTLGGTAVKIKAMAKPSYSWDDIGSKPETATRWPKWNEIAAGADVLPEGTSNWTDNTEILTSYASNNGFADTNAKGVVYRRDALCAYNYIKGKLDSVYAAKATTLSGYGITDAKIASGVITLGSNTITPVTSVNGHTGSSVSVTAADLGLSKAMRFIGVATVAITDGSTTDPVISGYTFGTNGASATAGDVIIDKDSAYEYVWSTTKKWERLGGDSSYKVVQTAVSSATAETTTATTFVHSVTQDSNGVITVKTRPLPTYNNYSHPTGDGNKHVPANGTSNNGKFLQATATAGSYQWASITKSTVGLDNVTNDKQLPLAGGTMTGDITFTATTFSSNPTDSKGLVWSGGTDGAKIFYRQTANNAGSLVLQVSDDGEEYINFRHTAGGMVYLKPNTREFYPNEDNKGSIGTSNYKWANMYATTFNGALIGNVTGNVSGSSGSCTGNAATATAFSSGTTVKLTGDTTGESSSSTKGWSVATTTSALTIKGGRISTPTTTHAAADYSKMYLLISSSTMGTNRPKYSFTGGTPEVADGFILDFHWDNSGDYRQQLALTSSGSVAMSLRGNTNGTWSGWTPVLTTANVITGGTNGTIKFGGTEVAVKGLGSAAYTASTAYATAAQGTTADNALARSGGKMTGNITGNAAVALGTTAEPFHNIVLGGAASNTMTAESTNPRITFQQNTGDQPVHLIYTDYDSYRAPAGLKIVGGTSASPAWLEVEGAVYAARFNGPLTGNVTGNVSGSSGSCTGNAASATKIAAKLATTTKTFLLGTSTTITGTAANVDLIGDTGVYLTTTAGELSAVRHSYNVSGTEKAYTTYNSTDNSIDFIFL